MFNMRLVAHRGYPLRQPENTLPSVEAALRVGARYVEIDIQLSQDGEPVLFHDRDLQRLCKQAGHIHDYPWSELQAFAVYLNGQTRPDWRMAHLDDFVRLLNRWPGVQAFIEIKRNSLDVAGEARVVERILRATQGMTTPPVLISYSLPALQQVRKVSALPVGAVMDDWTSLTTDPGVAALQAEYLFCDIDSLPARGSVKPAAGKLAVYECTDPVHALEVLQRGVDLVETFAIGEMLNRLEAMDA